MKNPPSPVSINYQSVSHFEGLNALRFFAAFLVAMHHSETIRKKNGLFNLEWLSLFQNGGNAVSFFFVLSGFLITYLLLKENKNTQTIRVKTFYLKRVLRIWPLYFFLVAIGTVILPVVFKWLHIDYVFPYTLSQSWYYFVFFVPALVTYHFGTHLLQPLWSIGVEEIFYLIWAPLVRFFRKHILRVILIIIIGKVILNVLVYPLDEHNLFRYIIQLCFTIEDMAVGGLGAWVVFNSTKPFGDRLLYRRPMQIILYGILFAFLVFDQNIGNRVWKLFFQTPVISRIIIDFLFLYLIIGISLAGNNIFKLKSKILSFFGEISYGIYMYHMLLVFGIILLLKDRLASWHGLTGSVIYYLILFTMVILVSAVSKLTFENYFLRLKKRLDKK